LTSTYVMPFSSEICITSLTECLEICRVDAIVFRDNPAARSSRMSFTLILLAIIKGLPSVKFEMLSRSYFTKGSFQSGAIVYIETKVELFQVRVEP